MKKAHKGSNAGIVSVLLGCVPSRRSLDAYVNEQYRNDDVICPLWHDLGVQWIDHDKQEVAFAGRKAQPSHVFLRQPLSYIDSYRADLLRACDKIKMGPVNAGVFIFDFDYRDKGYRGSLLSAIGVFHYHYDHPEWFKAILSE